MDFFSNPINVLLLLFVAVAVWAVVELALVLRRARSSVTSITKQASDTMDQINPLITKLDGVVDELEPAVKEVTPLLEKTSVALDEATESLEKINEILGDVSSVSGTAADMTSAVGKITDGAANAAMGVVARLTGRPMTEPNHQIEEGAQAAQEANKAPSASSQGNYVTYAQSGADSEKDE